MMLGMLGLGILWISQIPFGLAEIWWARRYDAAEVGYLEWLVGYWLSLAGEFGFICLALVIVMGFAQVLRGRWWVAGAPTFVALYVLFSFSCRGSWSTTRRCAIPSSGRRRAVCARRGDDADPLAGRAGQRLHGLAERVRRGNGRVTQVFIWDTLLDGRFQTTRFTSSSRTRSRTTRASTSGRASAGTRSSRFPGRS